MISAGTDPRTAPRPCRHPSLLNPCWHTLFHAVSIAARKASRLIALGLARCRPREIVGPTKREQNVETPSFPAMA